MLICQNVEGVHGQRKSGNFDPELSISRHARWTAKRYRRLPFSYLKKKTVFNIIHVLLPTLFNFFSLAIHAVFTEFLSPLLSRIRLGALRRDRRPQRRRARTRALRRNVVHCRQRRKRHSECCSLASVRVLHDYAKLTLLFSTLNHRKKTKAEPIRLIPRKPTANLVLLIVFFVQQPDEPISYSIFKSPARLPTS